MRGLVRELGVHHQTARRILDDAGVARRARIPLPQDDVVAAVELCERGATSQQVVTSSVRSTGSTQQEPLRAGVVMRPHSMSALGGLAGRCPRYG